MPQEILPQVGAELMSIPWGHIKLLIDKCKDEPEKALFYARQTLTNHWSRAVLQNFLDTDLYERQGKAVTNFALTLPEPQSDLAQEMTRDPYNFDFLTIRACYDEKELKVALMDNVQRLLMELGSGFAFVGREYRLVVGKITPQMNNTLLYKRLKDDFGDEIEVSMSTFHRYIKNLREQTGYVKPQRKTGLRNDPERDTKRRSITASMS